MSNRLGGGKRTPVNHCADVSKLHVLVLPDMATAVKKSRRPIWKRSKDSDYERIQRIGERPVTGDAARLKRAMSKADELVEAAIAFDPRLARKAEWRRRDEGEHVCAALLAEGDDQPFYKRTRNVVNEATLAGDPLKILISTDDKNIVPDSAAAFIATARLAQQFVPLQIWWQGAWLNDGPYVWQKKGFVFQVPLLAGDTDFSRLEFCIADDQRDMFSYMVMSSHCVLDLQESWNDCAHRAEVGYKPNGEVDWTATTKFISHHGITACDQSVANTAAHWLGWQNKWSDDYDLRMNSASASQEIPPPDTAAPPVSAAARSENERRWKQQDADRKAQALKEANERMAHV